MLHSYKDAITGRVYQVYNDEPPDDYPLVNDEDEEEEYDPDEPEKDWDAYADREYERYLGWLYGD